MNIGIIQSVIGAGGGNDMVLSSLLDALEKTNHNVTIYTIGKPKLNLPVKQIRQLFPIRLPVFGLYQKMLEPLLAKHAKNEDLVVALTGDLFLPHNKKQRMIFYSQNNYGDPTKLNTSKYQTGFWKYYYKPYQYMMRNILQKIKEYNVLFVANSMYVKDQLKHALDVEAKVIYPPVKLQEFKDTDEKKDGVITVGRYSKEKNLEKVIQIMEKLYCKETIFGSVSESNRPYYNRLVKNALGNNIHFYVNENRDLMKSLLKKSKVFLSASDETFGISVVEAMSCGCIPIVPNSTAHKETVPASILRPIGRRTDEEICYLIEDILEGKYDNLIPILKEHIRKFDEPVFQKKFMEIIEL